MKTITFDQHHTQDILLYTSKPVLNIIKIHYISPDNKDWITKVNNGNLFIKISALDKQYKVLATEQIPLSFSSYITTSHIQPVMEVDQKIEFFLKTKPQELKNCNQWRIDVIVNNLPFTDSDSLAVLYTDK